MTLWGSVDGSVRSFSAMDDEHLANVILHIQHYLEDRALGYDRIILREAQEEARKRKLSPSFLKGAPYPWRHKQTGKWYIWDFSVNTVIQINGIR